MTSQHEWFMMQTFALAKSASGKGTQPFDALVVVDGEIVLTAENTINTDDDCTRHAEMNLVSEDVRTLEADVLQRGVLYASTEPRPMCTGAIYMSRIPILVYSCPSDPLAKMSDGKPMFSCRELFARGSRSIQVIGPVLPGQGISIHHLDW